MPAAAVDSGHTFTFGLLCFTLWISGIDSAVGFIESGVTNIIDATRMARWKATIICCVSGICLSAFFTSNYGWVMFDMVDHLLSNYILFAVGICECVAVGWIFERKETAHKSENYSKSMMILAFMFWVPTVTMAYFSNFGFPDQVYWGGLVVFILTIIGFFISFKVSKLTLLEWYHEIVLCGTDKLAMSITALSVGNSQERKWWMGPFEAYFGLVIKFLNPAFLTFLIF